MTSMAANDDPRLRHGREMALNRLAFGILTGIYFTIAGSGPALLIAIVSYVVLACALLAWMRWRSAHALDTTLGCALIIDVAMISIGLHFGGSGNAALFPLYLWMILGNGFRLGIRPLFFAIGAASAGFAAVIATTPYWRSQPTLSFSLLASLVVLPAYSSTLIRKLSRARLEAEEASRAKSMFLAAISHELRTPLNAILGSVSLLEDTPLDEEQRSLFDAVRVGTQALLSLIGSVLDFSRVEAGLMPVTHQPLDLASLLVEIRDLVAIQARLKSLQLSIHVSPDVPLRIIGDRKHLLEVLVNLAANAVKFTESGGICLSVELATPAPGSPGNHPCHLRFEVSDTGIGIAPEALTHIFDVFSQADSSILDRFGGTGLGLAISRQLVTLMGGAIGVDSRPGQGSSFWFTIDLVVAPDQQDATTAEPRMAASTAVLLCDDPALVETIEASLHAQGLAIRHAAGLQGVLAPLGEKLNGEILFLYRRDPYGDLPGDCALLGRLDPLATMPRILLSHVNALPLSSMMLKRHFITALPIGASGAAMARACSLAAAATGRSGMLQLRDGSERGPVTGRPASDAVGSTPLGVIRPGQRILHVLVADDNDINRRVVCKILERFGHQVSVAEDGNQAVDAMETEPFDLVLMDVNMPGMNGLEATRLFRLSMPHSPRLPILALTADATTETQRNCLEAGMDGCITKPVTPARLIAAISDLVGADPAPVRDRGVMLIADHPRFPSMIPALDPAVLSELRTLGGAGFVAELLEGFIADAHLLIGRVDAAVDAQDMTGFRFELHALCSGAANIGAAALRDSAASRNVSQATLRTTGRVLAQRLRHELACLERDWHKMASLQDQSSA